MFNIDKQEFGSFVAMLRKEKGILIKQLGVDDVISSYHITISNRSLILALNGK